MIHPIINSNLDKALMLKLYSLQGNEYSTIFACSDVAVVEKQWLLECLRENKLVSIMPFLQHKATKEELRRFDYGDDML